jgi:serine protease AprX
MSPKKSLKSFFNNSYRIYSLALVILLSLTLISLAFISPTAKSAGYRAQPVLLEYATNSPDALLSIIVQKFGTTREAEKIVNQSGGRVTQDLYIINSFAAQVTAQNVLKIAQLPSVRWVSLDAPMAKSNDDDDDDEIEYNPKNNYVKSIRADKVWDDYQGNGIGVALLDSGINPTQDFYVPNSAQNRLVASVAFNTDWNKTVYDGFGHGTHIAGIIGGAGSYPNRDYVGVAPGANLVNVKVANDDGSVYMSSVIAGIQWIYENRTRHNIRVVNISLNSTQAESYNVSPLCAAVEVLWFNNVVVVVSAGNYGSANLYPPANDPFVITVGAVDEKGTADKVDDTMPGFSAYGMTVDGFFKPEIVAPGKDIISTSAPGSKLVREHPSHKVNGGNEYFRMSGTSTAAPMVSGSVALLLEAQPNLTPDQVKFRLMNVAKPFDKKAKTGAGYLDIEEAIKAKLPLSLANTGIVPSNLIKGATPGLVGTSVSWTSVSWTSVSWTSVSWTSVSWTSTYWGN